MKQILSSIAITSLLWVATVSAAPLTANKFITKPDDWFTAPDGIATIDNISVEASRILRNDMV
jgi:hypothetical protein